MDTDQSLLLRAKKSPNSDAWFTLTRIYEPLIAGWVLRAGVDSREVSDITQDVLQTLSMELAAFEHNGRPGAFRNWLKTTTIFRCRRYWDKKKKQIPLAKSGELESGDDILAQMEDPNSELSASWDREHDRYVIDKILELVESEFDQTTFQIFTRNSLAGESARLIADDLGVDIGYVYKAKFRVLSKLKRVAKHLVEIPEHFGELEASRSHTTE